LDCVGLFCPMPIMKTKQELDAMKSGEILEILADDPAFEKDLPAWCRASGQQFMKIVKEGPLLKGYVRRL
ncbi:MAG: sulfurtransferase TusA family protein, partial [Elusimicrobia bacterium]|nr:sulfurtransferase TusA family protein [Elusimicrobiota bacterium]